MSSPLKQRTTLPKLPHQLLNLKHRLMHHWGNHQVEGKDFAVEIAQSFVVFGYSLLYQSIVGPSLTGEGRDATGA